MANGSEIIGVDRFEKTGLAGSGSKGSEIIGQLVSLMAIFLLKTAKAAIVGHQTHRSGFRWPLTLPYLTRMTSSKVAWMFFIGKR